ncbi:MAG: hypothetical protein AMXMBFR33_01790 [Candidatus Xenobia bacterium]
MTAPPPDVRLEQLRASEESARVQVVLAQRTLDEAVTAYRNRVLERAQHQYGRPQ